MAKRNIGVFKHRLPGFSFRVAAGLLLAATQPSVMAADPVATVTAPKAAKTAEAKSATATPDFIPLGTSAFGPNGHGSYAWFVDSRNQQVVMCQVHNPQSAIECKRSPLPAP